MKPCISPGEGKQDPARIFIQSLKIKNVEHLKLFFNDGCQHQQQNFLSLEN
jgi:hypothetical protein